MKKNVGRVRRRQSKRAHKVSGEEKLRLKKEREFAFEYGIAFEAIGHVYCFEPVNECEFEIE